jgi:hypothetical protein
MALLRIYISLCLALTSQICFGSVQCSNIFYSVTDPLLPAWLSTKPEIAQKFNEHPNKALVLKAADVSNSEKKILREEEFEARLSEPEMDALYHYIAGAMRIENAKLRKGSLNLDSCTKCRDLAKGLAKIPEFEGIVVRFVLSTKEMAANGDLARYFTEGEIVKDPGFMSTTIDPINGVQWGSFAPLVLIMRSRTGRSVQNATGKHEEAEVLFSPQTPFKVLMKISEGTQDFVFLDEVKLR